METRKENLLGLIIEGYIKTAEPIGSKFLVQNNNLELSDATVRNEMRELEEDGYLTHPHTSAGRIPTEFGYKYYVEHLFKASAVSRKVKDDVQHILQTEKESAKARKSIAKIISEYLNTSVIIAFNNCNVYYTGISNLFSQPEFEQMNLTVDVSTMFDQCEEVIEKVFERAEGNSPFIFIGNENPLGNVCSIVGARTRDDSLFIILGPLRMDYVKSRNILEYLTRVI